MAIYTTDRIHKAFEILANGQHGYEVLDWDHEGFIVCLCREYDIAEGEVERQVFVKLTVINDAIEFEDDRVTREDFEHAQITWLAEHGMPNDADQFAVTLDRVCFLVHKDTASVRWQKGAEPDA